MRVGVATVDVRVNMTQYQSDLTKLDAMTRAFIKNTENAFSKMVKPLSDIGGSATTAAAGVDKLSLATGRQSKSLLTLIPHVAQVTVAYMAMRAAWRSFTEGVGVGVEFEKRMSFVKAVSGATAEEFVQLSEAARESARETIYTAVQTADALKHLSLAGFSVKEAITALPNVLDLALIGEMDLARATEIAANVMRSFGLEAGDLTRVNDVLTLVAIKTTTNIEELGQAMKFVAPIARALGYDIEETAAMLGVLANAGVRTGIAGRNLQQALARTTEVAQKMGLEYGSKLIDVLKQYNIQQEEMEDKVKKVEAAERIAIKMRKDFGLVALKGVLILRDNIKAYDDLYDAAKRSGGESAKAALIAQDNVDSAYKILKSILSDISISIYETYQNSLKLFLNNTTVWFTENKDLVADWGKDFVSAFGSVMAIVDLAKLSISGWIKIVELIPEAIQPLKGLSMYNLAKEALRLEEKGYLKLPQPINRSVVDIFEPIAETGVMNIPAGKTSLGLDLDELLRYRKELEEKVKSAQISELFDIMEGKKAEKVAETAAADAQRALAKAGIATETGKDQKYYDDLINKYTDEELSRLPDTVKLALTAAKEKHEYESDVDAMMQRLELSYPKGALQTAKRMLMKKYDEEHSPKVQIKAEKDMYREKVSASKEYYDDRISEIERFMMTQRELHVDEFALIEKSYADKQEAAWEYYASQRNEVNKLLAVDTEKDAIRAKLDKDYSKIQNKNLNDKTKLEIDARKHKLDAEEYLYKTINEWSEESVAAEKASAARKIATEGAYTSGSIELLKAEERAYRTIDAKKDKAKLDLYAKTTIYAEDAYKEIGRLAKDEYDNAMRLIGNEKIAKKAMTDFIVDENLKMAKASDDFFGGMQAQYDALIQHQLKWGEQGAKIVLEFSEKATSTMSDVFFDAMKGQLKSFGDYWHSFWDSMLKKFADILAEMAVRWALTQAGFSAAIGTGAGGSIAGGAAGQVGGIAGSIGQSAAGQYISSLWGSGSASGAYTSGMAGIYGGEVTGGYTSGMSGIYGGSASGGEAGIAGGASMAVPLAAAAIIAYGAMGGFSMKRKSQYLINDWIGNDDQQRAIDYMLGIDNSALAKDAYDRMNNLPGTLPSFWQYDAANPTRMKQTWGRDEWTVGHSDVAGSIAYPAGAINDYVLGKVSWDVFKNILAGIASGSIPSYKSGVDFVPEDTLAYLHRGEEVVPADGKRPSIQINSPLIHIEGNLIADKNTFNEFVDEIDYALNKKAKRVYS